LLAVGGSEKLSVPVCRDEL